MTSARHFVAGLSLTSSLVACNAILGVGNDYHLGPKTDQTADSGSGGVVGAGGTNGAGGLTNSGGLIGSGGVTNSGGLVGSGGQIGSGGLIGSGGQIGSGGLIGSGGQIGSGGVTNSGGTVGAGGAVNSGGLTGAGGSNSAGGAAGAGGSPTVTFAGEQAIPVGGTPLCVSVGDLDTDGNSDLVVATSSVSAGIRTFLSQSGGFGSPTDFATLATPTCVAAAEMNQDTYTDVVITFNTASNNVDVAMGNGTGALQSLGLASAASVPSDLVVADLNKDQQPDVVVLSASHDAVRVLFYGPSGTVTGTPSILVSSAYAVTTGDFDGDTWPDIAVAKSDSGQVAVLHNEHDGTFTAANFPAGTAPRYIVAGDANHDGKADLFVANETPGVISYLASTGSGFATPVPYTVADVRGLAIGDLNADGFVDVVSTDFGGEGFRILVNTKGGTFAVMPKIDAPGGPTKVTIGDVTADGKPDLIAALATSKSVGVFANTTP